MGIVNRTGVRHRPGIRSGYRARGAVLVAVLWALLLCAVIATGLARETRLELMISAHSLDMVRAGTLAEGAVQRALFDYLTRMQEVPGSPAERFRRYRLDGSEVRVVLADEAGRLNLNLASRDMLVLFFQGIGLGHESALALADQLLDWRDTDHFRRPSGREDAAYRAAGVGYEARDAQLRSSAELALLPAAQGLDLPLLLELVTVYSGTGGINPQYADTRLLDAMNRGRGVPGASALDRRFITRDAGQALRVTATVMLDHGTGVRAEAVFGIRRGLGGGVERLWSGQRRVSQLEKELAS